MRTFHFTTVVSTSYLYKFLAMQDSLCEHCKNYHLFALCVDTAVYNILGELPLKNITLLLARDLEKNELLEAKNNRNHHEYCWTLKPFILNYAMKKYKDTRYFAHLDSDLFFYSDLEPIINEAPLASLFLSDHNNSESFMSSYETSGRFNTGFVCCKNDSTANDAVEWWLARCFEKCSLIANPKEEIYGDQRYVEKWPQLFSNVHVINTKGANVAQWNIEGFCINSKNSKVYINNDKLIFYHFSGLSILGKREYSLSTFYRIGDDPFKMIYMPYIKNLYKHITTTTERFPDFKDALANRKYVSNIHIEKL